MININPREAMILFGRLVEACIRAEKGPGLLEVLAHRMTSLKPLCIQDGQQAKPRNICTDALNAYAESAADSLLAVTLLFEELYPATVTIDGKPIADGILPFSDRVVLTVTHSPMAHRITEEEVLPLIDYEE